MAAASWLGSTAVARTGSAPTTAGTAASTATPATTTAHRHERQERPNRLTPVRFARRARISRSRDVSEPGGRTLPREGRRGVMLTIAWIAIGVVLIGVEVHHLAFY